MSFDYNPYKHVEIILDDDGTFHLYCHSCGAEFGKFVPSHPIAAVISEQSRHLRESHKRTPEDFANWSRI